MSDTKTKHTPGPWHVGITKHSVYQTAPPERRIALCADRTMTSKRALLEEQANARLIAAAPELLSALEGIMAAPMSTKAMHAAHAAIAKARGGK